MSKDEVSWWSTDASGRPIKVSVPWSDEPYEAEFEAWRAMPWWRKLLTRFGIWPKP